MPTNMPPKAAMPASASPAAGKVLLGLLGLAVGFLAGYGIGRVSTGTPINPLSEQKGGYEAGYQAAMQKVADSGLLPPTPTVATDISGTVESVSGDRLTFNASLEALDPLGLKDLPERRVATITDATVIVRLEQLSQEEMEAAQRAYAEAIEAFRPEAGSPGQLPTPPSTVREVSVTAADIRVGDQVSVTAASDILSASEFEAVKIMILPLTAAPQPPTGATPPPGPPGA